MRILLSIPFIFMFSVLLAQNQTINFDGESRNIENSQPVRQIFDEGIFGVQVQYSFPGANVVPVLQDNLIFQKLFINGFSHSQEVGKASLPSHIDIFIIPDGATPTLSIVNIDTSTFNNFFIFPALGPASDEYGASEPDFVFDSTFYSSGAFYPSSPVVLREVVEYKGITLAFVEVFPIQYLPSQRKLYAHSQIDYKLTFTGASQFLDYQKYSKNALKLLSNYVLNNTSLDHEIQLNTVNHPLIATDPDYLIITHTDYAAAADSLAQWKRQMGFNPEIIISNGWTSSQVKSAIHTRYQNNSPKPDYFVIIGDNDKVPGQVITSGGATFTSDLYYACMDGGNDYVPDMAYGRISVANTAQAMTVVKKIINYERFPVSDSSFYQKGMNCAYFQHAGNGYAERRFAQTSEEIRNHIVARGYNVDRVYYTENTVNPLYWNNGYYSAGESIPTYLQKPTFPWTGNATHINNGINEGRFYVFHRDHGMSSGWGDPYYTTSNVNALTNGNKLPIVFSINCLTGKYMDAECFAEKFLRMPNGGAAGVFGHGEVSYSGYNDGLALGLVDAIWSSPGLVPNFTGSGGVTNPTLTSHTDIFRLGDVKNQGLIRMIETWGGAAADIKYTHELLNYFGDPAMEIFTGVPLPILATVADTINCTTDSVIYIANANFNGVVTLVSEDELIASAQIVNGAATLYFPTISGSQATLTITGHNRVPLIKKIIIVGGCPKARFTTFSNKYCLTDSVLITNQSTGNISSYTWNFGIDAVPATASGAGPFYVKYSTSGNKVVNLTVIDSNQNVVTYQQSFVIDQHCRFTVPATGNVILDQCTGLLTDDGGIGNYSDNSMGSFTISPAGASTITLSFNSFEFESGYDYLKIYNGPNTNSPLIGSFTGNNLPNNGTITSTSGSITIEQQSDSYMNFAGFELIWQCSYPNSAPASNFSISDSVSCDGVVSFSDLSLNGPTSWFWDFGDGTSSTQNSPSHIYSSNGTYSVKLIVTNAFGSDTIIKNSIVSIQKPNSPTPVDGIRCKTGSVDLTTNYVGSGTIWWYSDMNSSQTLYKGNTYTTASLSVSDTFFAELHEPKTPMFTGKADNSGGGSYFTTNSSHYLVFDCFKAVTLKSVLVYAGAAGNRTIQLRNSSGSLILSKTVNIPAGSSRVELNFELPVGMNLRLVGPVSPNLYRNNAGINYPYSISNTISIKHSSASTDPTGYYYFFYDWEIIDGDCVSDKTPVRAVISDTLAPVADFSFSSSADPIVNFQFTGNYGATYYWDFGDGDFSILENPNHTYLQNGTYNVTLIATNSCGQRSTTKQVTIVASNLQTPDVFSNFMMYPNPARNTLYVDFQLKSSQVMECKITDVTGKTVYIQQLSLQAGTNNLNFNISNFAQGVYFLNMLSDEGVLVRRFTVE